MYLVLYLSESLVSFLNIVCSLRLSSKWSTLRIASKKQFIVFICVWWFRSQPQNHSNSSLRARMEVSERYNNVKVTSAHFFIMII